MKPKHKLVSSLSNHKNGKRLNVREAYFMLTISMSMKISINVFICSIKKCLNWSYSETDRIYDEEKTFFAINRDFFKYC